MRIEHNGIVIVEGAEFENVQNFRITITPLVQRVQPLRAGSPRWIDRGVISKKANWTSAIEHKTIADAEAYCWAHRDEMLSPVGPFKVTGSAEKSKNVSWANGALLASAARYSGRTTWVDWECEAGKTLSAKPT